MKLKFKFHLLILLPCVAFFVSCSKEKTIESFINPPNETEIDTPKLIRDSLSGTEVLFNDVIFESADFFGLAIQDVYAGTPARPDLFSKTRPMDVSIKFDTSSIWLNVPYWSSLTHSHMQVTSLPNFNGFTFEMFNSILFVFAYPLNYQLVDAKISIKVKFL